jgi:DNA-directed RNA polymerase subunit M/transcription elongation factor TFIIS
MAVARCDDSSPYGMTCPQCNDLMIAPSRSVYVSRNSALHCWSCDTCGHDADLTGLFNQAVSRLHSGDCKARVFLDG